MDGLSHGVSAGPFRMYCLWTHPEREPSFLSCTHRWADVPRAQTPGVGRDLVGFPEIGSGNAAHVAFRGKCSPVPPVGRRSAQILARNPRTPHREETSNTRNVGANYFLTWLPNRSRQGGAVRHCCRCETVCQKPAADAFIGFLYNLLYRSSG